MGERWLEEVVVIPVGGPVIRSVGARWADGAQACAVLVVDEEVACSGAVAGVGCGLADGMRLSSMWMWTGVLLGMWREWIGVPAIKWSCPR